MDEDTDNQHIAMMLSFIATSPQSRQIFRSGNLSRPLCANTPEEPVDRSSSCGLAEVRFGKLRLSIARLKTGRL